MTYPATQFAAQSERMSGRREGAAEAYSIAIDRLIDVKAGRMTIDEALENLATRRNRVID